MEAILYNCCSTAKHFRLQHILKTLSADLLLLTGMRWRWRSVLRSPYETVKMEGYTGYIWGYGDGALTNKAAGVGIFIVRKFTEERVVN